MNCICRTCLLPDKYEMESIYSIKCINDEFITISKMISLCVGLEFSKHDNFTNVICRTCIDILISAYSFRGTCWDAHISLLLRAADQKNNAVTEVNDVIEILNGTEKCLELQVDDVISEILSSTDEEENLENDANFSEIINCTMEDVNLGKDENIIRIPNGTKGDEIIEDNRTKIENAITEKAVASDQSAVAQPKFNYLEDHTRDAHISLLLRVADQKNNAVTEVNDVIEILNGTEKCLELQVDDVISEILSSTDEEENLENDANFSEIINCTMEDVNLGKDENIIRIPNGTKGDEIIEDNLTKIENAITEKAVASDQSAVAQPVFNYLDDHTELIYDKVGSCSKRYNCLKCTYLFVRRDVIIDHLRLAHDIIITLPNGCMSHTCNICHKLFDSLAALRTHKVRVHNPSTYICEVCGATIKNKISLEIHLAIHSGEKRHKCSICDYRTAHKNGMGSHYRSKHSEYRPYICHICGKGFPLSSARSAHMLTHSDPQYDCVACEKRFKTRTQYNKHIAVHDISKHKACDLCGKTFTKQSAVTIHRKTHTGEKNHTCKECGKGFLRRSCWRTHMKVHHNQIVV